MPVNRKLIESIHMSCERAISKPQQAIQQVRRIMEKAEAALAEDCAQEDINVLACIAYETMIEQTIKHRKPKHKWSEQSEELRADWRAVVCEVLNRMGSTGSLGNVEIRGLSTNQHGRLVIEDIEHPTDPESEPEEGAEEPGEGSDGAEGEEGTEQAEGAEEDQADTA